MLLIRLSCLLSLLIASSASAVSMAWTPVDNPGNACETQTQGCFGAVPYSYYIGTYEVTNGQYAEFLNAKAAIADPLGLYDTNMGFGYGGITRTGSSGSYTYSVIAGRGDMPVTFVSFYDSLRFANWLNNGQGTGDTETGAYTLFGGTPEPSNGATVTRNAGASIVLTSENEWYKAAYYSALGTYFDYPAGSDTQTTCATANAAANQSNCNLVVYTNPNGYPGDLTPVGSYTGSASPFGTFDQGGNAWEWNESIIISNGSDRGIRGGSFYDTPVYLATSRRGNLGPTQQASNIGFRLAMIPEPSTGLLVIAGLLGLAGLRSGRA